MAFEFIGEALSQRQAQGLYRNIRTFSGATGRHLTLDGRQLLNFASNDYLGLAQHPKVVRAWQAAANTHGVGSGASFLITGTQQAHSQLVDTICELTGYPDALLFSSGAAANHGVLTALLKKGDLLLQDKLNHASLLDGGLASGALMRRFLHNDLISLAKHLGKEAENKLVVTEGVFSMDGDRAPVAEIARLCHAQDAWLMVDDAHGLGVIGANGLGSLEGAELGAGVDAALRPQLYMATCGKALGVGGAFVAASADVVDYLRQFCRQYVYTTAIPPAQACAITAALNVLRDEPEHVRQLQRNIRDFREDAKAAGLQVMPSDSAIQPIVIGGAGRTLAVASKLATKGFWVGAIRPPTVGPNASRLRITLSAAHQKQDISNLIQAISDAV